MQTAALFVLVLLAVNPAKKPDRNSQQANGDANGRTEPPVIIVDNRRTGAEADHTKQKTPEWDAATWAQWALVGIGILTFIAVWRQAKETAKATQAMRDSIPHQEASAVAAKNSADALVNAERAWITAKVENIQPGSGAVIYIAVRLQNEGRTPAKVRKILATRCLVPIPENSWRRPGRLPDSPIYDPEPTTVIQDRDFIIPPSGPFPVYVFIFPAEFERMCKREVSLYVYGEIVYLDTIKGEEHRTGFCETYFIASPEFSEPEGFRFLPNLIPEAYIRST